MNVTWPEGEMGDIGVLNPASTTAPVTRQSGHSLGEVMERGKCVFKRCFFFFFFTIHLKNRNMPKLAQTVLRAVVHFPKKMTTCTCGVLMQL